jgi:hypothetical protein
VIITIIMGVYPNFVFDVTHASVANLVHQSQLAMAHDEHFAANRSPAVNGGRAIAVLAREAAR